MPDSSQLYPCGCEWNNGQFFPCDDHRERDQMLWGEAEEEEARERRLEQPQFDMEAWIADNHVEPKLRL